MKYCVMEHVMLLFQILMKPIDLLVHEMLMSAERHSLDQFYVIDRVLQVYQNYQKRIESDVHLPRMNVEKLLLEK